MKQSREKFFIVIGENEAIALRYDPNDQTIMIGGYVKHEDAMVSILVHSIGLEPIERKATAKNKIRFVAGDCPWHTFLAARKKLESEGFQVVRTKSHGRLLN